MPYLCGYALLALLLRWTTRNNQLYAVIPDSAGVLTAFEEGLGQPRFGDPAIDHNMAETLLRANADIIAEIRGLRLRCF